MYVKKPVKPYYGTVTPHSNFSAIRDAAAIQKAIEAKGKVQIMQTVMLNFCSVENYDRNLRCDIAMPLPMTHT